MKCEYYRSLKQQIEKDVFLNHKTREFYLGFLEYIHPSNNTRVYEKK